MDFDAFVQSLAYPQPAPGLPPALLAMWWDAKGDWARAHECAQERDDADGMLAHAYLHRKEGDQPNADYWYRRSGTPPSRRSLEEEWTELVHRFLDRR